ncbi:lysyl-tRNA synthetase class 2 [Barrientosiimonas humi]|uniref:Lysine--tRNA ligase n=1 Tax=Barrientosiimonas humi TaxID=999931 RepID=A0A542XEF9_9MICO|nr:bifunctional lysylphosphatidylglycerol synthetase/lysine--tRNA ligase LysX [Barrientosiimonas humi]TQL34212.1 lysyl-tRNA synthetase class 2 [Barrientosiimonas humi]
MTWRERVARTLGNAFALVALWSLVSWPWRHSATVEAVNDALGVLGLPAEPSLFVIAMLLVLAGAVRRRLRAAYVVVVVLVSLSLGFQVLVAADSWSGGTAPDTAGTGRFAGLWWGLRERPLFNVGCAAVTLAVLLLVAAAFRQFPARLAHGSRRTALVVLVAGLLASFGLTLALTVLMPGSLDGLLEEARWALRATFGQSTSPVDPTFDGRMGHQWIFGLAGLASAAALVLATLVLLRGNRASTHQSADEELAVRRLLLEHGEHDSLGYFATRRDKSVLFSRDGRAALTYRVEGTVCVASADPVGARSGWPEVIGDWLERCRTHGWHAAVLSCSEEGARAYVAAGLRPFALGDEAIVELDSFSLSGRDMRPVRQAVTRVARAGYTARVRRHSELDPAELAELERLADAWRGEETERGFSMALNRVGDPADGRCVVVTAHDPQGQVRGFLSFVPWGTRGLSLDLMRRDRTAPNGLNEFLVSRLAEQGPGLGVRRVSLNFAVFRNVFAGADQVGAGPVTRLTDAALSFASRFYQLETLYRSNDKYRPQWVPRLLCYDPALTVARAGIAMGVAEGFLPVVGPRFLTGPRVDDHQPPRPEAGFVERVRAQEEELLHVAAPAPRVGEQQRVRRAKADALEGKGLPAYPPSVERDRSLADVRAACGGLAPGARTGRTVSVTGRVRAWRDLGGVTFAVLEEEGALLQVLTSRDETPAPARETWVSGVDLGDLVSVTGEVGASRTGELSVVLHRWAMAAKCLHPVPPLRARLSDDVRVRNRSLDLITNPDAVDLLRRRSAAVRALREIFAERGFLEVETPMLQAVHGGAAARPFTTHINAYDTELFLRIAPELYLKRLAVGGMPRIFELNRNFRNEGADATHNPEFTSLEAYAAYGDYTTMRELMRSATIAAATAVNGRPVAMRPGAGGQLVEVDLTGEWPVVPLHEAVSRATGARLTSSTPLRDVAEVCREHGVDVPPGTSAGRLVMELYEALVEKQTTYPTFYTDFPVEVSPLARRHREDPRLTEQWDLVAWGAELGTAYTELTDPIDQRQRLTEQSMAAAAGDLEAMQLDEAFLAALELGMPPTGGLGFGVDRLVMLLAGVSIRPTLAFPFVRPQP